MPTHAAMTLQRLRSRWIATTSAAVARLNATTTAPYDERRWIEKREWAISKGDVGEGAGNPEAPSRHLHLWMHENRV